MARKKNKANGLSSIGSLSADLLFQNLLFVLFISMLGLVYIANAHFAEKKVRQIQAMQKEVKMLRWEYMAIQAENMYNSKLTVVQKTAKEAGLRLRPPEKIIVD